LWQHHICCFGSTPTGSAAPWTTTASPSVTFTAGVSTTLPFTVTWPSAMSCSASRREHTPAAAMRRASRMLTLSRATLRAREDAPP
jgi:hypothetical protein